MAIITQRWAIFNHATISCPTNFLKSACHAAAAYLLRLKKERKEDSPMNKWYEAWITCMNNLDDR